MSDQTQGISLALNRQLCFALYASSRAMTKAYQPMLKELGITYPQYLVLLVLWEWDETGGAGDSSLSALGQRLMLDSGTLTPLLKRMQAQGLIERERSGADERVMLINITAVGRALKPRAKAWREQAVGQLAVPPERLSALHGQLWELLNELQATKEI